MKVIDFFDRGATAFADRPCLVDEGTSLTFAEAKELTGKVAAALRFRGVGADEKVAILSPNGAIAFAVILGVFRLGAVWVPINAASSVDDNGAFMNLTGVGTLFVHPKYYPLVPRLRELCPQAERVIGLGDSITGGWSFADFLAGGDAWEECEVLDKGRIVSLFATGGTTGLPKAVMFTDLMWETMIATMHLSVPVNGPPVNLVVAPMTHGAGAVGIGLICSGATNIFLEKFDAGRVLEAIEEYRVTHLFLPPTAIYMLLDHPNIKNHDYSSLQCFLYAAAPMSVDRLRQAMAVFGPVMVQTFGQAEAPLICTCLDIEDHKRALFGREDLLKSCGRATFLTRVAIMGEDGKLLPVGDVGEIVVSGNLTTPGYYQNPGETAKSKAGLWHRTSDVGYQDAEGYLYIVDRKRDMIISGGFNIFPSEIEQVIWSHPAVADCAVVGTPDDKWGEAVKAVIELKPGASVSDEDIISLCRAKLGAVKTPKSVEFWPELPRSAVGKVLKKDIRARFWRDHSRKI